MKTRQELFDKLQTIGIGYELFTHEPLFTCEQASKVQLPGAQCKSLFLKDNKKQLWLIVACASTTINLKQLSKTLQAPGLRFADANLLMQNLGVLPGSVTPFGIINDANHMVKVIFDNNLFAHAQAGFHPLSNDATLIINPHDLYKFAQECGNEHKTVDLSLDEFGSNQ